jgi:hypothetical protein
VSDPVQEPVGRRRAVLVGGAALVVVALVVALVLGLTYGDGDRSAAAADPATSTSAAPESAAPESSAAATDSTVAPSSSGDPAAAPAPEVPVGAAAVDADGVPLQASPVALTGDASNGDGITASLPSIRAVDATATGPGNVDGPALAVTVRIVNGRGAAIALDGVEVTLTYSAEAVPGSPVDDPAASRMVGTLADGGAAEGVYVFSVPSGQRQLVTVTVGYGVGKPLLVFTGPVA